MKTAALVASFALAQPDAGASLETLLDRLSTYLLQYEKAISEVIADEEGRGREPHAVELAGCADSASNQSSPAVGAPATRGVRVGVEEEPCHC